MLVYAEKETSFPSLTPYSLDAATTFQTCFLCHLKEQPHMNVFYTASTLLHHASRPKHFVLSPLSFLHE